MLDMKKEGRKAYYYRHGHDVLEEICEGQDIDSMMYEIAKRALDGTFSTSKKQIPIAYYSISEIFGEREAIKYARRCGAAV